MVNQKFLVDLIIRKGARVKQEDHQMKVIFLSSKFLADYSEYRVSIKVDRFLTNWPGFFNKDLLLTFIKIDCKVSVL